MMRAIAGLLIAGLALAADLPISGISHVGFRVSDLEKARAFYTGVLGYEVAFEIKDAAGKIATAHFKVNDDQFIEISPNLPADQDNRFTHVAFLTPDIEKMRGILAERGLDPPPIRKGNDGDLGVSIKDPDGHRVEFMQYVPGSKHSEARGKFLGANRISDHLLHTGLTVADLDKAMAFYRDKLGFVEIWRGGAKDDQLSWINMRAPGPRGDYVEFMLYHQPPTRQQLDSMEHICLEVPDIQAANKTALARGTPAGERYQPKIGRNRRWQLNLFDPDGTRTELMEPKTVE